MVKVSSMKDEFILTVLNYLNNCSSLYTFLPLFPCCGIILDILTCDIAGGVNAEKSWRYDNNLLPVLS